MRAHEVDTEKNNIGPVRQRLPEGVIMLPELPDTLLHSKLPYGCCVRLAIDVFHPRYERKVSEKTAAPLQRQWEKILGSFGSSTCPMLAWNHLMRRVRSCQY